MKSKKIGSNVKKLRIERKLTQEELARSLNISVKKVQKLEEGTLRLNTKLLVKIRTVFEITGIELVNGHPGLDKKDINEAASYLYDKVEKKYILIKLLKRIGLIICIILVILSILGIVWLKNNKDLAYTLSGESNNFKYYNSLFLRDNGMYYFMFGTIEIKNKDITEQDIDFVRLKCGDRLIIGSSNFLTGSTHERKGYDELFPDEVVENLDDWYYEITYRVDDELITEILEIENENLN